MSPLEASFDALKQLPEFDGHESITLVNDQAVGLKGFIAVHNTNRGPAVGGTRYWHYGSDEEALRDALRLSRAMTYKCALADVPYGGGKAVLMAPADAGRKSDEYLQSYAHHLKLLEGHFFTGEDVGLTDEDVERLETYSDAIIGRPTVGGLPAHWAAESVLYSLRPALSHVFGSSSFAGRSFAVKGVGNVGAELTESLAAEGARVTVADIDERKVDALKNRLPGIEVVDVDEIRETGADVFVPCALSGDLSQATIPWLQCKIICGAANNQLVTEEDGARLFDRGILYIPDYVANSGGLINVVAELDERGYDRARVEEKVRSVAATVERIIKESDAARTPTSIVADNIARARFASL